MFDSIGQHQDEGENRRRVAALGIVASAAAFVGLLYVVVPRPTVELPPTPETAVLVFPDDTLQPPTEPETAPVYRPPVAPEGGGDAPEDEPKPLDTPLDPAPLKPIVNTIKDDPSEGRGTKKGLETGIGGPQHIGPPCPEGQDCTGTEGTGGGPMLVSHTALTVLDRFEPAYPAVARSMGYDDERCVAAIKIDRKGHVYEVEVEQCPTAFHRSVERALLKWRFAPVTTETGDPVEAQTKIAVRFTKGGR